jgi:hypothetical protein
MAQLIGGILEARANQPVTDHPQAALAWAGPANTNPSAGVWRDAPVGDGGDGLAGDGALG